MENLNKPSPMWYSSTWGHDMIIGRKWMAYFDIWLDVPHNRLVWPQERQALAGVARELHVSRSSIRDSIPNLLQQQDAERSDELLGKGAVPKPVHILKVPNRTEAMDRRDSLAKMNRALTGRDCRKKPELSKRLPPLLPEKVVELDIAIIGAVGMHRNLRRKNSDVYITSIYEIDRAIEDKTEQPLDEDLKES
ncbi:hypothetical protein Egran_01042, partial [Elaphomyces granulatus]